MVFEHTFSTPHSSLLERNLRNAVERKAKEPNAKKWQGVALNVIFIGEKSLKSRNQKFRFFSKKKLLTFLKCDLCVFMEFSQFFIFSLSSDFFSLCFTD